MVRCDSRPDRLLSRADPVRPAMMVRLIFIRHGQTAWDTAGRYQGRTDTPICAAGVAEARLIARRLLGTGIEALVSSPMRRALATAEILAPILGALPCTTDARLAEIAFGEWEGMTPTELRAGSPGSIREWKRSPETFCFPGGEPLADARARLRDFLRHPPWSGGTRPHCVAAVTHPGVIRLATLEAQGRPLADYRRIEVPCADLREFLLEPHGRLRPNSRWDNDRHP